MLSKWIKIRNSVGLHARPVSQLAAAAANYRSKVQIRYGGLQADVKNSARILAMGINAGEVVELVIDGEDEIAAFAQINDVFDEINSQ